MSQTLATIHTLKLFEESPGPKYSSLHEVSVKSTNKAAGDRTNEYLRGKSESIQFTDSIVNKSWSLPFDGLMTNLPFTGGELKTTSNETSLGLQFEQPVGETLSVNVYVSLSENWKG